MMRHQFVVLAGLSLLVAGCSILAPRPNRTRYYFLSAVPAARAPGVQRGSARDLAVGLGPLKLPDYLNRTERAVRVGPNQLRFLEDDRWAESLDTNVLRVLSEDLTARLGTSRVVSLPTLVVPHRAYDVPLEILRFESTAKGDAELSARWGIKDGNTGAILLTTETDIVEPASGSGADAAVAALSRALGRWSDEISAALLRVSSTHPLPRAQGGDFPSGQTSTRPAR